MFPFCIQRGAVRHWPPAGRVPCEITAAAFGPEAEAGEPLPDHFNASDSAGLGLFEFHRADAAIALGAEATEKALEQLGEAVQALG